ncbi:MAG: ankyrin repeat domain-containing protein [Arcobacteraceae bacterium]|jgi:ankyrin repeat protein|nr:ankyrin repeat domain-containing protein [Arcobacteraceae bacterium]MDY0326652.1 ankyrin repeat domain-containing protein [Arcobacteraceae bacterium]
MIKIIFLIIVLLNLAFSSNVDSNNGWNDLHLAIYQGDKSKVELLLKTYDIDSTTKVGLTPLHIAIKKRDIDLIKYLLDQGADIEAQDDKGFSPLYYAVVMNHIPIATLLLSQGANPNTKNNIGNTPLHQMAHKNRTEMFELFTSYGVKVDVENNFAMKPIDFAIEAGNNGMIMLINSQNR